MSNSGQCLAAGSRIDRYEVQRCLGGGGFSLVYLAADLQNGQRVVIKEYLPSRLARRDSGNAVVPNDPSQVTRFDTARRQFLREAGILAELSHPNIVNVVGFFCANGTVYIVMEYQPGKNLQYYIRARRGRLSETLLRRVFPPLLDGLREVHARGLLHLDIKPANIHLRPGGKPLLLDFGAAHPMRETRSRQNGQIITPGFAPIEQTQPGGYVGPWSDIYAIGATMRSCIEGRAPPAASERYERDTMRPALEAFRKHYSEALLRALDWAMEVDPLLRPQSVNDLIAALQPADATGTPDMATAV